METFLKTGFAQISLAAQKIRVAQNLGGLQPPPAPPGPYAYDNCTCGTELPTLVLAQRS